MGADFWTRLFNKTMSARWLFTVACAAVFVGLSFTGTLPVDDVKLIINTVLVFYFTRNDRGAQ